ncbi:Ionotropic receptor 152, partial [Hyalella azteca]
MSDFSRRRRQHRLSSRDARISVFAVLKILLNQPQERDERLPLMRLLLMTTMLWGFLLSTFYRTFLTSMLVLPRVVEPFNTLEELVTKRPMPYTLTPGSYISAMAKEAEPNSTLGKLYRNVGSWEKDFFRAVEKVVSGKYASVGIKSSMFSAMDFVFAKTRTCPLIIKDNFLSSWLTLGFRKNSPYTAPFNKQVKRLRESGILNMLEKKGTRTAMRCLSATNEVESLRPLALKDFYGVFLVYVGG